MDLGCLAMGGGLVTGADNIAIGQNSLDRLSTGTANIAIGLTAATQTDNGNCNIAIGKAAYAVSANDGQ